MPGIGNVEEIERDETRGDLIAEERRQREIEGSEDRACESLDRISEAKLALMRLGEWP